MFLKGGISTENAREYINAGASHVIITSFVFQDGNIDFERLDSLINLIGSDHLVIDLSCRKKPTDPNGLYYVVTNKWTKFTEFPLT